MKKDILMPAAERMFVVERTTIDTIAAELNIAEKTVRLWKKEGGWDAKRLRYHENESDFHADLYTFSRKLMQLIQLDMDRMLENDGISGEDADKRIESRINSMSRLLDKLPKTKDYESGIKQEKAAEENSKEVITGDVISQKVREILGG